MVKNYKKTVRACYLGLVTQAIAANFAPLLFLKFHYDYDISLGKVAAVPAVFYITQLITDALCARCADKIGYRKCIVGAQLLSAVGLIGLAFLPEVLPTPFMGIIFSTIIYAVGSGLIEVLCSPIVEACPSEDKEAAMSLLHSFYCWGSVGVILLSTVFFSVFGIDNWKILACLWALIPLFNTYNFMVCPIENSEQSSGGMKILSLLKSPVFFVAIILMICSGASEMSMAQWASAFAESALGLSKTIGDLAGPCMFAVAMGISRVIYGKFGERLNLTKFMIGSGIICLISYLIVSISQLPVLGLVGCIMCGFSVGIMWPGTISVCAGKLPAGGTAMFAILAMAGDLGGAAGPSIVGIVTQRASDNLQMGLFFGSLFPLLLLIALIVLKNINYKKQGEKDSEF